MLSGEPAPDKFESTRNEHVVKALVLWSVNQRATWAEAERNSVRYRTTGGLRPLRIRYKPSFKRPKDPAGKKTFPLPPDVAITELIGDCCRRPKA